MTTKNKKVKMQEFVDDVSERLKALEEITRHQTQALKYIIKWIDHQENHE